jgi:hypothetical protein
MGVPGVRTTLALMGRSMDTYAKFGGAGQRRFLVKPDPEIVESLDLMFRAHDAVCLLKKCAGEGIVAGP